MDFKDFRKGDRVWVGAEVETKLSGFDNFRGFRIWNSKEMQWDRTVLYEVPEKISDDNWEEKRNLIAFRLSKPYEAIVIGQSTRVSGIYRAGHYENPGKLLYPKVHKVILVIPIYTRQYIRPVATLPEYLEKI